MTWDFWFVFLPAMIAMVAWGTYVVWIEGPSRHQRCLENIERLERELGIGQPVREPSNYTQVFGPGARWEVSHHDDIRFFDSGLDPKSALARDMMARGMLYSAEYEAARQMLYPEKTEWMDDMGPCP